MIRPLVFVVFFRNFFDEESFYILFRYLRFWLVSSLLPVILVTSSCIPSPDKEVPIEEKSAEEIFNEAEDLLRKKTEVNIEKGISYLNKVELLHPYSPYAKRALITLAVTYHEEQDFENARLSASRFLEFYPADDSAAHAQFIIALSYYDEIEDIGRDQALMFKALKSLNVLIEKYPESDFVRSAKLKFDLAFDHLAAKEMDVGRYYLKRGHYSAAINRFRVVIEDFQTTSHVPEALHRLVECYLSLGLNEEAQTAAAVLGHNYQSSNYYNDTYNLLGKKGLNPKVQKESWLVKLYRKVIKGG